MKFISAIANSVIAYEIYFHIYFLQINEEKKKRPCIVVFTTFTDFHQQREHTRYNEEGMNYWYTHAKHLVTLVRTRRAHQPILLIAFRYLFLRSASYLDAFSTYRLWRSCSACLVRQQIDQWPRFFVPLVLEDSSTQISLHFQ